MPQVFNLKNFNAEVFLRYKDTIVDPVKVNLIDSGVLVGDPDIANALPDQVGGNYLVRPLRGLLAGTPDNYDGQTNISAGSLETYSQGIIAVGRAKGFTEKDFTYSITGVDFMLDIAGQTGAYWNKVNQNLILSVLKGAFASALSGNILPTKTAFDSKDIIDVVYGVGHDHQEHFKIVFMHSDIAKLVVKGEIDYIKYTDVNGITRDTNLFQWQNKIVIVNDKCPKEANATDPTKYDYTCYVLGERAITWQPLNVKVPAEMARDPRVNGGEETLYTRQRVAIAPFGVSFKSGVITSLSPTDAELETGSNWELVKDTSGNTIDTKTIPLAVLKYTL